MGGWVFRNIGGAAKWVWAVGGTHAWCGWEVLQSGRNSDRLLHQRVSDAECYDGALTWGANEEVNIGVATCAEFFSTSCGFLGRYVNPLYASLSVKQQVCPLIETRIRPVPPLPPYRVLPSALDPLDQQWCNHQWRASPAPPTSHWCSRFLLIWCTTKAGSWFLLITSL